jgi:Mrp family chromosome partitioning ATPase
LSRSNRDNFPVGENCRGMTQMTGEFPRAIARPVWLTARARNAVHRPIFIGAVGASAFIAALVALVLAPQQSRRVPPSVASAIARPDTSAFTAALAQARSRMGAAETSLEYSRSHPPAVVKPDIDTLARAIKASRDTLSNALSDLDALLNRAEGAPLAASYRALAESPQLANSRAKALLDSLNDIERDREAFGSSGGADPVYVALTSRAAEIGRAIQAVAQERRDVLRQQIAKLIAPAPRPAVAQAPIADTAAWIAERDSARSMVVQATTALTAARTKAQEYDREASRANSIARLDASPVALLAAALVFGVALGFGSAFLDEMRHPRVSDEHEVERVTGARVLATIRPQPRQPERRRRQADRDAPPYFDPGADGYQLTYLHVARTGASRLMLTIAGPDTGVAAVVGVNVAAIAADEARSTIIIDTDSRTSPVAAALRTHAEPGIADIMDKRFDWPEVTSQAMVGRDRVIDVLPSGITLHAPNPGEVTELFRREGGRMARHYEAIVVVTSLEQAVSGLPGALPISDTVICARVGHTRLADLQRALDSIRSAGGNPLGIVLWDAPPPALPTPERVAAAPRPLRTAEMKAITTGR